MYKVVVVDFNLNVVNGIGSVKVGQVRGLLIVENIFVTNIGCMV